VWQPTSDQRPRHAERTAMVGRCARPGSSPPSANPSIPVVPPITTDNGDLACDDVAGSGSRAPDTANMVARFSCAMIDLTGRCSRDRR
jgi:hypothetical protein